MNLKDKLVDPRIMGLLAAVFLLIGFADVLFVSDASSMKEMTGWGFASIIAFLVVLGWVAIFMFIIPLANTIFGKLFGKHDNPTPPAPDTKDSGDSTDDGPRVKPVKKKKG